MRMHAQTAMIENGFVHLPRDAGWLPEYLHELTTFPKGKHDDQVDSTAQMLDWMKRAGSGPSSNAGIWHLYREQYEAQQAGAAQSPQLPAVIDIVASSPLVVTTPGSMNRRASAYRAAQELLRNVGFRTRSRHSVRPTPKARFSAVRPLARHESGCCRGQQADFPFLVRMAFLV
jgi:hypothetical protein